MDAYEIGKRITYLREKKEMTKNKLATKAGVSPTYIYQVEKGEKCPTIEYLDYICFGLGVSLCEFFSFGEDYTTLSLEQQLLKKISSLSPSEQQALLILLDR